MKCPRCGGTNIKKIGIYYQCQTGTDPLTYERISGCGFIGKETDFIYKTTLDTDN